MAHPSSQNPELPPTGMRILHSPTDLNEKLDYSSIAREAPRYSGQRCLLISDACARTTDEKKISIFELFNMFSAHGKAAFWRLLQVSLLGEVASSSHTRTFVKDTTKPEAKG